MGYVVLVALCVCVLLDLWLDLRRFARVEEITAVLIRKFTVRVYICHLGNVSPSM
jgi:hypothetical protein